MQNDLNELLAQLLPQPAEPYPCPKCGRKPRLIVGEKLSHYECRRWLGLKLCLEGPTVIEGYEDGAYAQRAAARAWNKLCAKLQCNT